MSSDPSPGSIERNFLALVAAYAAHESQLVSIARRLPNIAGQDLGVLGVDEITDARLEAAFASYGAEHDKGALRGAIAAWDDFFGYLLTAGVVSDNPMARVARPRRIDVVRLLESGTFKTILASLLIPLLLFVLAEKSKVANSLQQAQEERRRDARIELINATRGLFEEVSSISAELIVGDNTSPLPVDVERSMELRLQNLIGPAQAAFGSWTREFPVISDDDTDNVIAILNAQFEATASVAHYLNDPQTDEQEARELRRQLRVIEDGVRTITRYYGLGLLNCLVDIADNRDERPCGKPTEDAAHVEAGNLRNVLDLYARDLQYLRATKLPELHNVESHAADSFRRHLRSYALHNRRIYRASHPQGDPSLYTAEDDTKRSDAFEEAKAAMREIDPFNRRHWYEVPYSREYLEDLAEFFEIDGYANRLAPECPDGVDPSTAPVEDVCLP